MVAYSDADGAGVDIVNHTFWAESLARHSNSWIVLPSGRTSWGLDWHGPSAKDAWNTLDALGSILQSRDIFHPWAIQPHTPAILMGHSNGGQGAWYCASRFPDRVVAGLSLAHDESMRNVTVFICSHSCCCVHQVSVICAFDDVEVLFLLLTDNRFANLHEDPRDSRILSCFRY